MTWFENLGWNLYVVGAIQMGYDDGFIDACQTEIGYCNNERHGPIQPLSWAPSRSRFDPHGVRDRSPSWWWMFRKAVSK